MAVTIDGSVTYCLGFWGIVPVCAAGCPLGLAVVGGTRAFGDDVRATPESE